MNEIGIRQGRLSPPSIGPIQRFPQTSWKDEFESARECGFAFLEWLLPAEGHSQNPIWSDQGAGEIRAAIAASGVQVQSLCADYFIAQPFVRVSGEARMDRSRVLSRLVLQAARVGIAVVVVPLLEAGEIRQCEELAEVRAGLAEALDIAAKLSIVVALEADVPAATLASLVDLRPHAALGVCYDTGNGAARGFDVAEDLTLLGPRLSIVHVKDRDCRGVSVALGSGVVDFPEVFRAAADRSYPGPLVLENPRGHDPVGSAKANLAFTRTHVDASISCLEGRAGR